MPKLFKDVLLIFSLLVWLRCSFFSFFFRGYGNNEPLTTSPRQVQSFIGHGRHQSDWKGVERTLGCEFNPVLSQGAVVLYEHVCRVSTFLNGEVRERGNQTYMSTFFFWYPRSSIFWFLTCFRVSSVWKCRISSAIAIWNRNFVTLVSLVGSFW